jgi:hypothetical protein
MGGSADRVAGGPDGLSAASADAGWNRFAGWSPRDARLALIAFLAIFIASAFVPVKAGDSGVSTQSLAEVVAGGPAPERARDEDLALYDRAIERIQHGENYYDFIVAEHRIAQYPVRPGVAVRLPTLAYIDAWLGTPGQIAAAFALLAAVLLAWWRRLGEEVPTSRKRLLAFAFLMIGATLGLTRHFFVLHELWAGMLLALSFGLHRPGKWGWSLAVAALAVAIREHALPFVLLMAAMAVWRRDWKEGAAWSALVLIFLAMLGVHLHLIGQQVLPSDPHGQGWMYLRGLSGWISNVALSSNLRFLPDVIVGPIIMLAMLGWATWRTPAGAFGFLLYAGYGLLFMIAGRPDTYYWGVIVAPAVLVGLAFAAPGLRSLLVAATDAEPEPQTRCA